MTPGCTPGLLLQPHVEIELVLALGRLSQPICNVRNYNLPACGSNLCISPSNLTNNLCVYRYTDMYIHIHIYIYVDLIIYICIYIYT
jgi:hypothetical protein